MVCLNRPYHFKFFKGCVPRISFGPFLNNLTQMCFWSPSDSNVFDVTHDYRFLQQAEIEELNQTIADLDDYSFKYDTVFDNLEDDLWRIHGFITMPVTAGLRYLWSKYWQRVVSKCFSCTSSCLPFFWEAYQIRSCCEWIMHSVVLSKSCSKDIDYIRSKYL